ncbi:MAG: outer membrane protein assembly factor BamA [Marivibrio sp.]|uniref:outer membrane protein assembly factor BamA n=1 Tax=Marivibrio sp. TaxID=2039719 RepID=UPI0032EBBE73
MGTLSPLDEARAQSSAPTIIEPAPSEGAAPDSRSDSPAVQPGQPVLEEIEVRGAQRIEPATVRSYIGLQPGDPIDANRINEALKALFATDYFADVAIAVEGRTLIVEVVENPIINRIAFEGNQRIENETLNSEVRLRPRLVYTRTAVQNDVRRILDLYRRSGRFAATVDPKVIQQRDNRVDLVFEIDEGPLTGIEKISFIGNRYFSDSALREEIQTKESRWYRFLSSADVYDPDRLTFDRELLRRFYLAEGFADFRVVSAVAELSEDRENFFVTFTIEEGERYQFGEFDVISRIPDVDPEPLQRSIELESGDWYNANAVEDTVLQLTELVGDQGYAFIEVRPNVDRNRDEKTIDITFEVLDGPRTYVERIEIRGNTRTEDEVIRREFLLVEGDAFNATRLRRSRQRISDLGFFKQVEVNNVPGSEQDRTVVQVDVEEQSTGQLNIGAGYSTQVGALAEFAIRERNLLGKGQDLRLSTTLAQSRQSIDLSFTEPYFLDRQLSAGFDLFHTLRDNQDEASFDSQETGFGLRTAYEITRDWRQRLRYRFAREIVENVGDDASRFVKQQEGTDYVSSVGQSLIYDQRNSRVDPTDGYFVELGNDLAGVGGTVNYFRTTVRGAYYFPLATDYRLSVGAEVGHLAGWGEDDTRIKDRFFLGGDNLRGFESSGAGPRDIATDDSLGGNQFASSTAEFTFPLGLPEEFGVTGALFTDVGTLTSVDESGANVRDTGSVRASVGTGLNWRSPFGPVRVDFSQAVVKEDFDKTEIFRFSFGTRF